MSAFNTATVLLFPGIGLVALAIGLLSRRYSASAFTVCLIGLLTLTTASTWISSAGPITDTTQPSKLMSDDAELKEIKAEVERLVGELHDERSSRDRAERCPSAKGQLASISRSNTPEGWGARGSNPEPTD